MRLLLILLCSVASICLWTVPTWAQYQQRQIQIDNRIKTLNGGRTFYLLVKKTTETSFLTEDYDEISALVSSSKKNKDVLVSKLIWPGKTRSVSFDAPASSTLGVYLLLTNPDGDWKTLVAAPMKHHYTLTIHSEARSFSSDVDRPPAVQLLLRPRPYPQRIVDRPLTLYPGMLQVDLWTRFVDQPAGQAAVQVSFGALSSIQAGVALSVGAWDDRGLTWGRVVTPQLRFRLADSTALDLSVPVGLDPTGVGLTIGLPSRLSLGAHTQIDVGQRLMSFRLYQRAMDPYWPDEVDTASMEFRFLGNLRHQMSAALFLMTETGFEINAYEFSATEMPIDLQVGYAMRHGFDIGLTGGIQNLFDRRPVYHFGLALAGRIGGD